MPTASATQSGLSPACLRWFGLARQPFATDPGNPQVFTDPILDMRRDRLWAALVDAGSIVVVTGPPGAGKTTLLHRLQDLAAQANEICLINGHADTGKQAIQHAVRSRWVPAQGYIGDLDRLSLVGYLCALIEEGQQPKLAVDNADNLRSNVVAALCDLKRAVDRASQGHFGLLLTATSPANELLASLQAQDGSTKPLVFHHPPLNADQTAAFVLHALHQAGCRDSSLVNPSTLTEIHAISHGLVSAIGPSTITCLEAICGNTDGQSTKLAKRFSSPKQSKPKAGKRAKTPEPTRTKRPRPAKIGPGVMIGLALGILLLTLATQLAKPPTDPQTGSTTTPAAQLDPLFAQAPSSESQPPTPVADERPSTTNDPPKPSKPTEHRNATAQPTPPNDGNDGVASRTSPQPIALVPAITPSTDSTDPDQGASKGIEPTNPPTQSDPPSEPADASPASPPTPALPDRQPTPSPPSADWLLAQPETHYTVQVAAVSSADQSHEYIREFALADAAFYRAKRGNSYFFIIVAGIYPSNAAAEASIAQLPANLRKTSPWTRTLAQVQADIRRGR